MSQKNLRQFARMRGALLKQPLNMEAAALDRYCEVLDDLRAGHKFDQPTLQARLGMGPETPRVQIVGNVAVLSIRGYIDNSNSAMVRYFGGTSLPQLQSDFRKALSDAQIKAIVFYCDSPGGIALGNEEVSAAIYAARGVKPIGAYVRGMCASAAYYLASAVDSGRFVASPSSPIGSIGTILRHADVSQAWQDYGVEWSMITFGKHKADGASETPLTAQGKATLQQYVDAFGQQFAAAVARNRGVGVDVAAGEQFGQGKVFLAAEALRRGLVDRVGDMQQLVDLIAADIGGESDSDPAQIGGPLWGTAAFAAVAAGEFGIELSDGWPAAAQHDDSDAGADAAADTNQQAADEEIAAAADVADAAGQPQAAAAADNEEKNGMKITAKIKAALYAFDLIDAQDAGDDVCQAALRAAFRGAGRDMPQDEAELLKQLGAIVNGVDKGVEGSSGQGAKGADGAAANTPPAADADEAGRNENIVATGRALGIAEAQITDAVASGKTFATITSEWRAQLEQNEPPIEGGDRVNVKGAAGWSQFVEDASDALLARSRLAPEDFEPSAGAEQFTHAPLLYIARQCLEISGRRDFGPFSDPEATALAALQMQPERVYIGASGPALNRPGDFPALLSALTGKMLDQTLQLAEATYPIWTARLPDVQDFKPKSIVAVGGLDELDRLEDDDETKELKLTEENPGWIQADRFGNKVGLTPTMVANDDLDGFAQALLGLQMAHENTINRLCISLIANNVTMLDGNALYSSAHGNDITSGGGAPGATQATAMKLKHRQQTGINAKGHIKTPPRIALLPSNHEDAGDQTFLTISALAENKIANTDGNINVHRGRIRPVVEPDLDAYSTNKWYTFADPRVRRVIAHVFQRGYGRGGRRSTWFNPDKKTRYVDVEGRFAAAAVSFRGSVRNSGTA